MLPRQENDSRTRLLPHTVVLGLILEARNILGLLSYTSLPLSSTPHILCALLTQAKFGRNGSDCPGKFCLFQSETKNLLFNDNTECLAKLQGKTTYEKYLGLEYVTAIANLRQCSTSRKWPLSSLSEKPLWMEVRLDGQTSILGRQMGVRMLRQYRTCGPREIPISLMRG